jgi:hypothetical protein
MGLVGVRALFMVGDDVAPPELDPVGMMMVGSLGVVFLRGLTGKPASEGVLFLGGKASGLGAGGDWVVGG